MMRKLLIIAYCLLLSVFSFAQNHTIRLLAVGDEFSQDAVNRYLHDIGKSEGVTIIIGDLCAKDCSLGQHSAWLQDNSAVYTYCKTGADGKMTVKEKITLKEALADEAWDFVSLQQNGSLSGQYDTFEPALPELAGYIRKTIPATSVLLFHQTWAYAPNTMDPGFETYGRSNGKMYDAIVDASRTACGKYGLKVIPCGSAIECLQRCRYGQYGNFSRDGIQLNKTLGQLTASFTWYETLTGRNAEESSFAPAGMWDAHVNAAKEAAHRAVTTPFSAKGLTIIETPVNTDETKVPEYILPDPLTCLDGSKIRNARQWMKKRRPELLNLFETEMYGKVPGRPEGLHFKELYCVSDALSGKATRKEVRVFFDEEEQYSMDLLIYLPNGIQGPFPAFMGVNFDGNKYVWNEPGILSPEDDGQSYGIYQIFRGHGKPTPQSAWYDVPQIIGAGYALITFCRYDLDPDFYDAFENGVHPLLRKGQEPSGDQGGAIAAWAWGLSRAMDYAETDPAIDAGKIAVMGHSRLGKTALWAAAEDSRFAIAISNASGCGGATLSRRPFGETLQIINAAFPHWFCENFHKYSGHEEMLPFDQHELIALIAPRPVYVASGSKDQWCDPKGEYLSALNATPVYKLFGFKGLEGLEMPAEGGTRAWGDVQAYHLHEGDHDVTTWDWKNYIEFADRFFRK